MEQLRVGYSCNKLGRDGISRRTTLRLSADGAFLSWTGRYMGLFSKSADERVVSVADIVTVTGLYDGAGVTLVLRPQLDSVQGSGRRTPRGRSCSVTGSADGRTSLMLTLDESRPEESAAIVRALQTLVGTASAKGEGEASGVDGAERLLSAFPDVEPGIVLSVLEECGDAEVAYARVVEMMRLHELPALKDCDVCLVRPRATRFDCGHTCCCQTCADILLAQPDPLCEMA